MLTHTGQCLGGSMGQTTAETGAACREICEGRPGCAFFSHFSDTKACLLVSACDALDETCDGYCVHGTPTCDGVAQRLN